MNLEKPPSPGETQSEPTRTPPPPRLSKRARLHSKSRPPRRSVAVSELRQGVR
uniref:Uncharacterized protein n=1 Tax=Brassica oleracea TaxID=3712 RepID=A0A3P6DJD5_BRAOL